MVYKCEEVGRFPVYCIDVESQIGSDCEVVAMVNII